MERQHDEPRCWATHNPGKWPYVSRCVKPVPHWKKTDDNKHRDKDGNEWEAQMED